MTIEIEESQTEIAIYFNGNFQGSMSKPKNFSNLSTNKVLTLFAKSN